MLLIYICYAYVVETPYDSAQADISSQSFLKIKKIIGATLYLMQDLSFLTRGRTHDPCNGSSESNHWTAREVPLMTVFHDNILRA